MANNSFFSDQNFQDLLLALACRDAQTLRQCGGLLSAHDFRPLNGVPGGQHRWTIAQIAFEYWRKYKEPVGDMLIAEVKSHCSKAALSGHQSAEFIKYAEGLRARKLVGSGAAIDRALDYKKERLKASTIQKLIEEQQGGTLTDERWVELSRKAIDLVNGVKLASSDYFEGLEQRMQRRLLERGRKYPLLGIAPLDMLVHAITRAEMGLVVAPWKRGKSMCLIWIALAYVLQHFNVLYITLEDPKNTVDDRFDACVTGLTHEHLRDPKLDPIIRRRFQRYKSFIKTKLHIVDGTGGGISVQGVDDLIERERDSGFLVDVVVIDYDEKLVPPRRFPERRFESDAVYSALIDMASAQRRNVFLWTAAQTSAAAESIKVITGGHLAEDRSKIRKVTFAIALGAGDWGPESVYINVAAHRTDQQLVGCNIYTKRNRSMFYDHLRTLKKMNQEAQADDEEEEMV